MSINFSQFPTPTLPINAGDFVVGYQNPGTNNVPTLAQYTMTQIAAAVQTIGGPAGGDLSGTYPNPTVSAVHATSGTISAGVVINQPTQPRIENTTLVATDAFVNQQIASSTANVPIPLVGGVYNQASLGTGTSYVIFASGGVISSVITVINGGTGYAVGDLLLVIGGNYDAVLRVTNVVGGAIQSGGLAVLYGGTGYTTGATTSAVPVPPGQRTVTATGVLTSNVTFIIQNGTFLTAARRLQFNNNTTGAFTVTIKLSNGAGGSVGTGVVAPQGTNNSSAVLLETDGVNDVWLADTPLGIGAVPIVGNSTITGNVSVTGTLTPSQTNGIVGTTTNNNANTGSVGEYVTNTASGVSIATGSPTSITSVSLTAGDWDVTGIAQFVPAGTTVISNENVSVSTTNNVLGATLGALANINITHAAGIGDVIASPSVRVSLSATTTVYVVVVCNFSVSTCTVNAFIRARRAR